MLEINGLGIRSGRDVQAALLLVEQSVEVWTRHFEWMVDRWGLEDASRMLYFSLYGYDHAPALIKPTHRFVGQFSMTGDPNDFFLEKIED